MKILVITPTYNEADNIVPFVSAVLKSASVDVLVVDDNSPDGTGEKVKELIANSKDRGCRVNLLERAGKLGLGTAYIDGFKWAVEHGYDFVVSMDADFSHDPKYLPDLLAVDKSIGLVIGSRYIKGGKVVGWGFERYANSFVANYLARTMLGLKPKDSTAGFRRYSKEFAEYLIKRNLIAPGYAFMVETTFLAKAGGFQALEVPITFVDRRVGESKIAGEAIKSVKALFKLFTHRRVVKQFVKFGFVGFANALLDWLIYFVVIYLTGWSAQTYKQIAKAIAFVFSASSSYIMNRRWTFRSQDKRVVRQASKFVAVALGGLIINNYSFYLANTSLLWNDLPSLIFATFIAMFWNFTLNKWWTFK